jgi:alpha-beta hydrolase superfamily lysophospholipase
MDYQSMGLSDGISKRRGFARLDDCVEESDLFLQLVMDQNDNSSPLFVHGYSLGGGISLKLAVRHSGKISGLVLTNPCIRLTEEIVKKAMRLRPLLCCLDRLCPSIFFGYSAIRLKKPSTFRWRLKRKNKFKVYAEHESPVPEARRIGKTNVLRGKYAAAQQTSSVGTRDTRRTISASFRSTIRGTIQLSTKLRKLQRQKTRKGLIVHEKNRTTKIELGVELRMRKDKLIVRNNPRMRVAVGFFDFIPEVEAIIPRINTPFIVIHGKDDQSACFSGSQYLYSASETAKADKCIVLLVAISHLDNFCMEQQSRDIMPWLAKQMGKISTESAPHPPAVPLVISKEQASLPLSLSQLGLRKEEWTGNGKRDDPDFTQDKENVAQVSSMVPAPKRSMKKATISGARDQPREKLSNLCK